jgi:hypothetical protein
MTAVRAPRHTQDPGPRLQAVTSEPFLILAVTGSSRSGDSRRVAAGNEKAPAGELAGKTRFITTTRGSHAFCRAPLPLPRQTLNFAAGIIGRHRIPVGSLWRKLNPGQQALLVLACLRKGEW